MLACDFANVQKEVEMVNNSQADWFHIDIMDGRFVPNISFGIPVLKAMKKHAQKPMDVHLMIVEPDKYLSVFRDAGADVLTVHVEACQHLHRTIYAIKEMGMKAGVAINPHTPVNSLHEIINDIDLVCVMSVNPGFGGQKFIPNTLSKLQRLRTLIHQNKANTLLEVDGGVTLQNAKAILKAGADVLVAGSTVFKAANPSATIQQLKLMNKNTVSV